MQIHLRQLGDRLVAQCRQQFVGTLVAQQFLEQHLRTTEIAEGLLGPLPEFERIDGGDLFILQCPERNQRRMLLGDGRLDLDDIQVHPLQQVFHRPTSILQIPDESAPDRFAVVVCRYLLT